MKTIAIIPSGGKGLRIGSDIPKQYLKIYDKAIIAYTLDVFQHNDLIDEIAVAVEKEFVPLLEGLKNKYDYTKIKYIVEGGKHRQDSVYNALKAIDAEESDLIAVHDAARSLLTDKLLTGAIKFAKKNYSAVVALKARDTLIKGNNTVESYIDRDTVHYAQTPQLFTYSILIKAMEKAYEENFIGSDESMLVKKAGYNVNIFPGDPMNIKLTTKEDLKLFKFLLKFRT